MPFNPYLGFNGDCREAFTFYQSVLGGEIVMMLSYADSPMAAQMPAEWGPRIMHARLVLDDRALMGGDAPPGGAEAPQGFCVHFPVADAAEAERVFGALAEGGKVTMPLQTTFFADKFGMLVDRFGTPWMIGLEQPQEDVLPSGAGPAFEITRTFDAPRSLVWKAHSEIEQLRKWWGPKGCKLDVVSLDFRPSGHFHYRMQYSNGPAMWGRFIYREIRRPERIAWINSFSNEHGGIARPPFPGAWPMEMHNTMTLTEQAGKTTLRLRSVAFGASPEERAFFEKAFDSLQQGFGGTYDQLADYLKTSA